MTGIETVVGDFISQYGFPVFVAVYLLIVFGKKIDANTKSNDRLHEDINQVIKLMSEQMIEIRKAMAQTDASLRQTERVIDRIKS